MRINKWILGVCAGAAFCIVGMIFVGIVALHPCGWGERTDYVGSLDKVFASHSPGVEQSGSSEGGPTAVLESPYGFDMCDYWPSPSERR